MGNKTQKNAMKKQTVQKVILSNRLLLEKPILFSKEIMKAFSITNPKYKAATKFCGNRNFKYLPKKFLTYWKYTDAGITVPRGSLNKIKLFYTKRGITLDISDETKLLPAINWEFKEKLDKKRGQSKITEWDSNCGILKAPTGSGKTVMFLWLMAKYQQPTIITVHTKLLLNQWPKRIAQFLGIKEKDIGIIGDNKINVKPVTIALMQTLVKHPKLLDNFGVMCIDEAHRSPAKTYTTIIENYKGKYLFGLSATPSRSDGLTNVMKWYIGGIHVSISIEKANLCECYYKIVTTEFIANSCFQKQYSKALVELARNQKRNKLIVNNIIKYIELPGIHLVISQNRSHCTKLFKLLPDHIRMVSRILTGKIKEKERKEIVSKTKKGDLKIIFATDKLIGEGFDEPLLSVGHQTTPISDKNRLIQYVGRIRRQSPGKKFALWFDYFDCLEGVLRGGARKRSIAYIENNIKKWEDK